MLTTGRNVEFLQFILLVLFFKIKVALIQSIFNLEVRTIVMMHPN